MKNVERDNRVWLDRIKKIVDELAYGSVHITVQDGKIVQIERTEKERILPEK